MATSPEFEAWVTRAREKTVVETYEMLGCEPLRKTPEGFNGPCPRCGGTDRFGINRHKNMFYCRQCAEGGDAIALVQFVNGFDFVPAVTFLTGEEPPKGSKDYDPPPYDDTALRERRAEERARQDEEAKQRAEKQASATASAMELFYKAKPFPSSPADKYLRGRGVVLTEEQSFDLRFIPALEYRGYADSKKETPETVLGSFPAMLAAIRDAQGMFIGVHRTYLDPDGKGKLKPPGDVARNNAKKVWGVQKNGHICLGPIMEDMCMAEGIESTASWFQFGIGPESMGMMVGINLDNLYGWCTDSVRHPKAENAKDKRKIPNGEPDLGRPGVILPAEVKRLYLLGDGDSDYFVTRAKALGGARRYSAGGIETFIHFAPDGSDFNNVLQRNEQSRLGPVQTAAEFEAEVVPVLYPKQTFKSKYGMLAWEDLDKPGPEQEWLVDSLLTARDKSVIAGPTQSGKSFFAITVGMAVARGIPVFDFDVQKGLVIYQAGEGALGVKKRLRAYRKHFNVPPTEHIPFVLLQSRIDLFSEMGDTQPLIDEISAIRALYEEPLRIIFIDTLATAQGVADENSGKDMARVLDNIDKIRLATGVHVCLVHHLNADGTKMRGHTSVGANIDQVLAVTCDKETKIRTVRTAKMKDGDDSTKFDFELMQVILGQDAKGREITSCVALPVGEKEALRSLDGVKTYMANHGEKKVLRALFAALKAHGTPPPSHIVGRIPGFVQQVVEYDYVKEVFARLDLRDEDANEPEKAKARRKAALTRARERLQANNIIGTDNPYVWFNGRPVAGVPESWPPKKREKPKAAMILAPGEDDDFEVPF